MKRIRFRLCKFRWRFWALRFGYPHDYGVAYEWIGVRVEVAQPRSDKVKQKRTKGTKMNLNLKFWTWELWSYRTKIRTLEREVAYLKTGESGAEKMVEFLRQRNEQLCQEVEGETSKRCKAEEQLRKEKLECEARLCAIYHRVPLPVKRAEMFVVHGKTLPKQDVERLQTLAATGDEDPLWKTVLSYVDEHEANEREMALRPGLNDGDRQFNTGRAANAYDFACLLRDLKRQSDSLPQILGLQKGK